MFLTGPAVIREVTGEEVTFEGSPEDEYEADGAKPDHDHARDVNHEHFEAEQQEDQSARRERAAFEKPPCRCASRTNQGAGVESLRFKDQRRHGNQHHVKPDEIFKGRVKRLQPERFDDGRARPQLVRQPEADREEACIHQLMDLHPN